MTRWRSTKICSLYIFAQFFLFVSLNNTNVCGQERGYPEKDRPFIDFERRLQGYLNTKTHAFFVDMIPKEKFLTLMIQSINDEIRARRKEGSALPKADLDRILGTRDTLIYDFSSEIERILQIIDELNELEGVAAAKAQTSLFDELLNLKYNLVAILENNRFNGKKAITVSEALRMLKEYQRENERLFQILKETDDLERVAHTLQREDIRKQIEALRGQIAATLLGKKNELSPQFLQEYYQEAVGLIAILNEVDQLKAQCKQLKSDLYQRLVSLKEEILRQVNRQILSVLGYRDPDVWKKGEHFAQYYNEWKLTQLLKYDAKLTQARLIKSKLVESGNRRQKERMFRADLTKALLSYSNENYRVAALQLQEILNDYSFFHNLDDILFYLSECYLAQRYYDKAKEGYKELVSVYPNSRYVDYALFKLMKISYTYSDFDSLFYYYTILKDKLRGETQSELFEKSAYLAGCCYFLTHQYELAIATFAQISSSSKYYLPSKYFIALCHANREEYDQAAKIFADLANKDIYPWTDVTTTLIRNNALLKLGLIYYEKGEYSRALSYFNTVSMGHPNYDQSLLGKAWVEYREGSARLPGQGRGKYSQVIEDLDNLLRNYATSNYQYEAMILSAQCKKLLGRHDDALQDFRYVVGAKSAFRLAQSFDRERREILSQLDELEEVEVRVLESGDQEHYPAIDALRATIEHSLDAFRYKGYSGIRLLEELTLEKGEVVRQLKDLDYYHRIATDLNREDLINRIEKTRKKLIRVLESSRAEQSISKIDYFADFPLAKKESQVDYCQAIEDSLLKEIPREKSRMDADVQQVESLMQIARLKSDYKTLINLELNKSQLADLRDRLNHYEIWLLEHHRTREEVDTEFEKWADYAGFGMTDIYFSQIKEREKTIAALATNIAMVNKEFRRRKTNLERKIAYLTARIEQIEQRLKRKKLETEKQNQEEYFRKKYFIDEQREKDVGTNEPKSDN